MNRLILENQIAIMRVDRILVALAITSDKPRELQQTLANAAVALDGRIAATEATLRAWDTPADPVK